MVKYGKLLEKDSQNMKLTTSDANVEVSFYFNCYLGEYRYIPEILASCRLCTKMRNSNREIEFRIFVHASLASNEAHPKRK